MNYDQHHTKITSPILDLFLNLYKAELIIPSPQYRTFSILWFQVSQYKKYSYANKYKNIFHEQQIVQYIPSHDIFTRKKVSCEKGRVKSLLNDQRVIGLDNLHVHVSIYILAIVSIST